CAVRELCHASRVCKIQDGACGSKLRPRRLVLPVGITAPCEARPVVLDLPGDRGIARGLPGPSGGEECKPRIHSFTSSLLFSATAAEGHIPHHWDTWESLEHPSPTGRPHAAVPGSPQRIVVASLECPDVQPTASPLLPSRDARLQQIVAAAV